LPSPNVTGMSGVDVLQPVITATAAMPVMSSAIFQNGRCVPDLTFMSFLLQLSTYVPKIGVRSPGQADRGSDRPEPKYPAEPSQLRAEDASDLFLRNRHSGLESFASNASFRAFLSR